MASPLVSGIDRNLVNHQSMASIQAAREFDIAWNSDVCLAKPHLAVKSTCHQGRRLVEFEPDFCAVGCNRVYGVRIPSCLVACLSPCIVVTAVSYQVGGGQIVTQR